MFAETDGDSFIDIGRMKSPMEMVSSKTMIKLYNSDLPQYTKSKIEKFIKKTGYVHNHLAGSLKSGKSGFVIAIIPTLRLSIFSDYIHGIKEKLRENGFELLIGVTNYNLKTEEELVRKFVSYKPEGFIVVGTKHTEATTRLLLNSKSPIVETWNITDKPLDLVVGFSNFSASHLITDYVISLDYKNIAFVAIYCNFFKDNFICFCVNFRKYFFLNIPEKNLDTHFLDCCKTGLKYKHQYFSMTNRLFELIN
jgi:hypothetical protein